MGLHKKGGGADDDGPGRKGGGGDGRRVQRVEREIREVIATHLLTDFRGELQGLVSVSRVTVTKDLRTAYGYISVLGEPGDAEASLQALEDNAFDVQSAIGRKLKMKFCPKIKFFLDESMDNILKVEKILRDISLKNSKGTAPEVPPADDESDQ